MVSSSGPTALAGLIAAPETGGTSLLVTGGAAVEAVAGTGMQLGAAKNAGAVISAMASKVGTGTSRRPSADVKKQADAAATGADGKQQCAYCQQELTNEPGKPNSKEYDHVDPWSRSKDSSSGNIKGACRTCNRQKGARTPEEWQGQQK